ncbi:hypothetical protein B9Z49_06675 [Limnohabitans sp. 2KL-51]|nr:hypothetical protein B9Z49_06675 [Limnohabitans sp. 2KL-51]
MSAAADGAQTHPHSHPQGQSKASTPRTVLPFDEKTWAHALQHGPRPAAYLFTTSYCSTCPAAFEVLHKAVQQRKDKPELNAVMMDVAGPQALRHAPHFKGMTQMYAFDGFEPAIRQAVDPAWPNVTPYLVLVDAKGQTQRVIGPPTPVMLKRWLAPA